MSRQAARCRSRARRPRACRGAARAWCGRRGRTTSRDHLITRRQREPGQCEHLRRGPLLPSRNGHRVDQQILPPVRRAAQDEAHRDATADPYAARLERHLFQRNRWPPPETEQAQRAGVAALDRAAQRMFDQETPFLGGALEPGRGGAPQQLGMRTLPDRSGCWRRCGGPSTRGRPSTVRAAPGFAPGWRRARARAAPTAGAAACLRRPGGGRVRCGCSCPARRSTHDPFGIVGDVAADARLGAEPLGQLVLRLHRQVEVVEAARRDEQRVRQVEERRHADAEEFVRSVFRAQSSEAGGRWRPDRNRAGGARGRGRSAGRDPAARGPRGRRTHRPRRRAPEIRTAPARGRRPAGAPARLRRRS